MQTEKPKRGFVQFIRKLEGKELKDAEWNLFYTKKKIGCELYQRYEGLLEWIAGKRDWDGYGDWIERNDFRNPQRQAIFRLRRHVLDIGRHTTDSMGMYNGDRSSTLGAAVEYILQHHQSEQQDAVSIRASGERLNSSPENYYRNRLWPITDYVGS